jgi:hypothetical protein
LVWHRALQQKRGTPAPCGSQEPTPAVTQHGSPATLHVLPPPPPPPPFTHPAVQIGVAKPTQPAVQLRPAWHSFPGQHAWPFPPVLLVHVEGT